jgi:putative transcriptional regulator
MSDLFDEMMSGLKDVEAYLAGKRAGYRVHVPTEIDVKNIRKRLNMTQSRFSSTFGFSLDAVKHWEGGRRTPEASARAFLTVISRDPKAVINALHPTSGFRGAKKLAAVQTRSRARAS